MNNEYDFAAILSQLKTPLTFAAVAVIIFMLFRTKGTLEKLIKENFYKIIFNLLYLATFVSIFSIIVEQFFRQEINQEALKYLAIIIFIILLFFLLLYYFGQKKYSSNVPKSDRYFRTSQKQSTNKEILDVSESNESIQNDTSEINQDNNAEKNTYPAIKLEKIINEEEQFKRSLKILNQYRNIVFEKDNLLKALHNLGGDLFLSNRLDEAEKIYQKLIEESIKSQQPEFYTIAHQRLGSIYRKQEKFEQSKIFLLKALSLYVGDEPRKIANIYRELSEISLRQTKKQKEWFKELFIALVFAEKSLAILEELNNSDIDSDMIKTKIVLEKIKKLMTDESVK